MTNQLTEKEIYEALKVLTLGKDGIRMSFDTAYETISTLITRYFEREKILQDIQKWDCLNPPQINLCSDFAWLKKIVDKALAGKGK